MLTAAQARAWRVARHRRWLAALGTRERFRTGVWYRSFGITPEELDRLVAEVGEVSRDRILARAELAAFLGGELAL